MIYYFKLLLLSISDISLIFSICNPIYQLSLSDNNYPKLIKIVYIFLILQISIQVLNSLIALSNINLFKCMLFRNICFFKKLLSNFCVHELFNEDFNSSTLLIFESITNILNNIFSLVVVVLLNLGKFKEEINDILILSIIVFVTMLLYNIIRLIFYLKEIKVKSKFVYKLEKNKNEVEYLNKN